MKKIVVFILMLILFIPLTSCSLLSGSSMDDHEYCDNLMKNLTTLLE